VQTGRIDISPAQIHRFTEQTHSLLDRHEEESPLRTDRSKIASTCPRRAVAVVPPGADPKEPVRLQLRANRDGGILGRLFCDLVNGDVVVKSKKKARRAAKVLTRRMHGNKIMPRRGHVAVSAMARRVCPRLPIRAARERD
jgi:hypothetical protein